MPIVNGVYQTRLLTVFDVDNGILAIKEMITKSRRIRISTIPPKLLLELLPLLKEKEDLKILLSAGETPAEDVRKICDIAISKTKTFADYKGEEILVGTITSPSVSFNILWKNDKIYEINVLNYERCVRCRGEIFEEHWRFADRIVEKIIKPVPLPQLQPQQTASQQSQNKR